MILFYDIFERALSIFDDPDISKKYYSDQAGFQADMLEYLLVGKDKFTSPTAITDKLSTYSKAEGYYESDKGDGTSKYILEKEVANEGVGVGFTYTIGGEVVSGTYDPEDNSVTFSRNVGMAEDWSVSWYFAGAFTEDFTGSLRTDFPIKSIMEKVVTILAYAMVSAWADKEVNRVLEIRNILTDTDFKMYSPANSVKAKSEWRNQINADLDTLLSELNWRILSTPRGGNSFGQ